MSTNLNGDSAGVYQFKIDDRISNMVLPNMYRQDSEKRSASNVEGMKDEGGDTILSSLAPLSPTVEGSNGHLLSQPAVLSQTLNNTDGNSFSSVFAGLSHNSVQPISGAHKNIDDKLMMHRLAPGLLLDEDTCIGDPVSSTTLDIDSTSFVDGSSNDDANSPGVNTPTAGFTSMLSNKADLSAAMISPSTLDTTTQMSLIQRSAQLRLNDPLASADGTGVWKMNDQIASSSVDLDHPDPDDDTGPCKAMKSKFGSDAPNSMHCDEEMTVFDADGATSVITPENFAFSEIGVDAVTFSASNIPQSGADSSSCHLDENDKGINSTPSINSRQNSLDSKHPKKLPVKSEDSVIIGNRNVPGGSKIPGSGRKSSSLSTSYPSCANKQEISIKIQPETQHRARYMTEGSRGSVKDQSQKGFPVIAVKGYNGPLTLQVFIGTDSGKVRPHGFYQAIKVFGKNSTECTEVDIESTTVVEMEISPGDIKDLSIATIDCVGILKLRNADVEQRVGVSRARKKSTRVRMIFRVSIPQPDGSNQILQIASNPISCTQPAGQPDICKMSLTRCTSEGGQELFIIGKNFTKPSKIIFQEVITPETLDHSDEDEETDKDKPETVVWSAMADADPEYFQAGHLICTIPPYRDVDIKEEVRVQMLVNCHGRKSEPQCFIYTPVTDLHQMAKELERLRQQEGHLAEGDVKRTMSRKPSMKDCDGLQLKKCRRSLKDTSDSEEEEVLERKRKNEDSKILPPLLKFCNERCMFEDEFGQSQTKKQNLLTPASTKQTSSYSPTSSTPTSEFSPASAGSLNPAMATSPCNDLSSEQSLTDQPITVQFDRQQMMDYQNCLQNDGSKLEAEMSNIERHLDYDGSLARKIESEGMTVQEQPMLIDMAADISGNGLKVESGPFPVVQTDELEASLQQAIAMAREQQQKQQAMSQHSHQSIASAQHELLQMQLQQHREKLSKQLHAVQARLFVEQKPMEENRVQYQQGQGSGITTVHQAVPKPTPSNIGLQSSAQLVQAQVQEVEPAQQQDAPHTQQQSPQQHEQNAQQGQQAFIKTELNQAGNNKATLIQGPAVQDLLASILQGTNAPVNTPILVIPAMPQPTGHDQTNSQTPTTQQQSSAQQQLPIAQQQPMVQQPNITSQPILLQHQPTPQNQQRILLQSESFAAPSISQAQLAPIVQQINTVTAAPSMPHSGVKLPLVISTIPNKTLETSVQDQQQLVHNLQLLQQQQQALANNNLPSQMAQDIVQQQTSDTSSQPNNCIKIDNLVGQFNSGQLQQQTILPDFISQPKNCASKSNISLNRSSGLSKTTVSMVLANEAITASPLAAATHSTTMLTQGVQQSLFPGSTGSSSPDILQSGLTTTPAALQATNNQTQHPSLITSGNVQPAFIQVGNTLIATCPQSSLQFLNNLKTVATQSLPNCGSNLVNNCVVSLINTKQNAAAPVLSAPMSSQPTLQFASASNTEGSTVDGAANLLASVTVSTAEGLAPGTIRLTNSNLKAGPNAQIAPAWNGLPDFKPDEVDRLLDTSATNNDLEKV